MVIGENRTPWFLFYLDEGALGAPDELLELLRHRRGDGRLDGDEQVPLGAAVLQDDGEGVLDLALDAALGAEEAGD